MLLYTKEGKMLQSNVKGEKGNRGWRGGRGREERGRWIEYIKNLSKDHLSKLQP